MSDYSSLELCFYDDRIEVRVTGNLVGVIRNRKFEQKDDSLKVDEIEAIKNKSIDALSTLPSVPRKIEARYGRKLMV